MLLGQLRVKLPANDPTGVAALAVSTIEIVERIPNALPDSRHSLTELDAKRQRAGHPL